VLIEIEEARLERKGTSATASRSSKAGELAREEAKGAEAAAKGKEALGGIASIQL